MRKPVRKSAAKKPSKTARGTSITRRNSSERKAYEPTQKEHELCAAVRKRRENAAPAVRFKVTSEAIRNVQDVDTIVRDLRRLLPDVEFVDRTLTGGTANSNDILDAMGARMDE